MSKRGRITVANTSSDQGEADEQHVKIGGQSHKNPPGSSCKDTDQSGGGTRGGSHEQHVKAGEQSHKNSSGGRTSLNDESKGAKSGSGPPGRSSEEQSKTGQRSPRKG